MSTRPPDVDLDRLEITWWVGWERHTVRYVSLRAMEEALDLWENHYRQQLRDQRSRTDATKRQTNWLLVLAGFWLVVAVVLYWWAAQ